MIPPNFLPNLQSLAVAPSSSASAGNGASFLGPGSGDWNVNLGGSGFALQSGTAGNLLLIAGVALVAVWLLKK